MSNERIIERVKKMLALARDNGATEGERDNALRMAHATIAKYNLDIEEIEAADPTRRQEKRTKEQAQFFGRPWARLIASSVADLLFCEYYYQIPGHTRSATKVSHHFTGRESNAISAALLAEFLVKSVDKERKARSASLGDPEAFARSFAWGAAHKIRQRVDEIIAGKNVEVESDSKALVLASLYKTEREKNEIALKEMGIVLRKVKSNGRSSRNRDGLVEGSEYGASLSLSPQVTAKPNNHTRIK